MANKIFPGEKVVKVGKYHIRLCTVEGCREPILPRGHKYCLRHAIEKQATYPSGKSKTDWAHLRGDKFYQAFDQAFGLVVIPLP